MAITANPNGRYRVGLLKSSKDQALVVLDQEYPGDGRNTLFLFHTQRNDLVRYRKEIVETLISWMGEDADSAAAIESYIAWAKKRRRSALTPQHAPQPKRAPPAEVVEDEEGYDLGDELDDDFDQTDDGEDSAEFDDQD